MNDHMNVQMDVDVEELVLGAARTPPLEKHRPCGVTDCVAKRSSDTMMSVHASFMGWSGHTKSTNAWTAKVIAARGRKPCVKKALEERHRGQERERKAPGIPHKGRERG